MITKAFHRAHKRFDRPDRMAEAWYVRRETLVVDLQVFVYTGEMAEKMLEIHAGYPEGDGMLTYALVDGGVWMFSDLGFHWSERVYEWQTSMDTCPFWHDDPCFYDGTSLGAMQLGKMWADARYDPEWLYGHLETLWEEAFADQPLL